MKKITISCLFFFILLAVSLCNAQIPGMVHYNEGDGLNSSYTYGLNQDEDGFIYIGSDNGFFRFDGTEFKQFGSKNGLKNIEILDCFPIPGNGMFIISFLNDFAYLKKGRIINSDRNPELKKIKFDYTTNTYVNGNTVYLYEGNNPKNILVYKNEKITTIPLFLNQNASDSYLAFGLNITNGLLYISDKYKKKNMEVYNVFTRKKTVCNISIETNTIVTRKGDFFILKNGRMVDVYKVYHQSHFKKIASYTAREDIRRLAIDKDSRIWACLENGGVLYFKNSFMEAKGLSDPIRLMDGYIIHDVLTDKDNNLWFSTRNNGLFFISDLFFKNYIHFPVRNNSSHITAITKNGNRIYLGYNKAKGGIYHNGVITDLYLGGNSQLENKAIFSDGNTTIFGLSRNPVRYNTVTGKKHALQGIVIKNMVPYTSGSVLFCTLEGLIAYNHHTEFHKKLMMGDRIYTALPYTKDSIFAGTFKDLYKLNTATQKKKLFLEGYYFTDIKKLSHNLYAGATNLNGVILFNNSRVVKKITENNGLLTRQIKKIEIENEKVFWVSTNYGLSRIEFKDKKLKIDNFTHTDGLPSNVVAGCVISGDTVYAGTSKGLGILSIKNLLSQQKSVHKKVIINSVKIGNNHFFDLDKPLAGKTPDNSLTFNVSFPDFASQGKISYRYKVEGLSEDWQTGSSPNITFNSIPPGDYIFKIFGLGYNGRRSYASTDLHFEIKPAFWQTWWFKLLLVFIGSVALSILITLYFQKKRNKKLETLYYEKKIAELELQAIKAQINPHFIYNCLNSIHFLLYKKDYNEAENYLNTFSVMIRKTLHYSEKTFMPIKEEAEYLSLYLNMEKLRLKDLFDYKITVSKNVNESWTVPSLLIQPFVENAIKHGVANLQDRKGNIEVLFHHTGTTLCVIIEDNGTGIGKKRHSNANSFGVKLSEKRIETFRQLFDTNIILEITDLQEKEKRPGTQITLYITPYENQNTGMHH
ncbi:histidine kinase [Chryseobacterium sp. MA9]|uniref:sensor histidine kinase n=1 Tax=Chryseobacterium sp. MA9 TaxID=2966625 RepID=UPI002108056F|nr:histidine kinase [Chryseobacterium sp. MA9]UTX49813.1 histidine kinase [Chryseobacterium sp. MA9]